MPNWCYNTITVVAKQSVIDDLEEHKFNFNYYVPRPPEEEENWYNWNVENWGTKWEVPEDEVSTDRLDEEKVQFEFATAWSPPIAFCKNLCRLYDKIYIELKFNEEGDSEKGILFFTKNNGQFKYKEFLWEQPYNEENIEELDGEEEMETIGIETPKKKEEIDITL